MKLTKLLGAMDGDYVVKSVEGHVIDTDFAIDNDARVLGLTAEGDKVVIETNLELPHDEYYENEPDTEALAEQLDLMIAHLTEEEEEGYPVSSEKAKFVECRQLIAQYYDV